MPKKNEKVQAGKNKGKIPEALDKKFVIPPLLMQEVDLFYSHCSVSEKQPVLIVGPTGVGKSLFLNLYCQHYLKAFGDKRKGKLCYVNCSHFDSNTARSELFGHVIGSFTDAVSGHDGWITKADNGVLILEEIGDLPLDTQAMLLSFIETGKYNKLGGTEELEADVLIVGATNKQKGLRDDFYYRFFPFYIPGIYKRRQDILYYFYSLYPDLLPTLTPWEVMTLLAHNWPGNVREIRRVGLLMQRGRHRSSFFLQDPESSREILRLNEIEPSESQIAEISTNKLYDKLKASRLSAQRIESLLNEFHLGLDLSNQSPTFNSFKEKPTNKIKLWDFSPKTSVSGDIISFSRVTAGLGIFCGLFFLDINANFNLLSLEKPSIKTIVNSKYNTFFLKKTPRGKLLRELFNKMFHFFTGVELNDKQGFNSLLEDEIAWLDSLTDSQRKNPFVRRLMGQSKFSSQCNDRKASLAEYTYDDLLFTYFSELLAKHHGVVKKAAKSADVNHQTFRSKLRNYGLAK
jgi:MoxR-like ATPase